MMTHFFSFPTPRKPQQDLGLIQFFYPTFLSGKIVGLTHVFTIKKINIMKEEKKP